METHKKSETFLGLFILAMLTLIGVMVFIQQFRYNPAVIAQSALETETEKVSSPDISFLVSLPENLSVMTPIESFTPDNLYEKINGQADLYLTSGFKKLKSQRYVRQDNQNLWFEIFIYDMGTIENAFSVYSQQYRDDGQTLGWTEFAYFVANAIFFVHGPYYIEMRAASKADDLMASMQGVAKEYVKYHSLEKKTVAGLSWFPKKDLETKSVAMVSSNAFGFDRLDRVYTAEYGLDGIKVTAYISKRASAEEAAQLTSAFSDFLIKFGGQKLKTGFPSQNGQLIEIMDSYDLIFSNGAYLAGVHEAKNTQIARELASRLNKQIGDMIGG